ncbi:LA_3751/LA_3752 family putative glycosyltransferase [Anabaena azotica]|uniref:LA_3751/LA_3752 family putative glycosyltransferase n=1 Tax=Anabaena azotica TaxID=197653 RepID=UPI0039A4855F
MNKLRATAPLFIILSGVIFSLYLLSQVPDDIYFSGDGGLKALLAKQLSSGNLRFDLNLQVPPWVHNIWDRGLYPFEPPFSYKISNLYYITFPFTFPLVTAPFYAIFGYRGFYIIPLISTWIIWVNFYRLCQSFKLDNFIISLGLITLIFASPLTMYSAMYWEHTLAVALAFSGLVMIFSHRETEFTNKAAILSGILIGLSVWFRPEFLALVAILMILVIASYIIKVDILTLATNKQIIFIISLILTVLCFFILNKLIYNHPLGAHAFQVVENFSLQDRLLKSLKFFNELKGNLFKHFPIIYFALTISVISIFKVNLRLKPVIIQILLISFLFLLIVPILIPSDGGKQWGSRFLLILIPLLNVIAISGFEKTWQIKQFGIRYISTGILAMLFILGFNLNIIEGTETSYQKGKKENIEVLNFLRKDSNKIVAVANQYVGQTFEDTFKQKIFFLTKQPEDVSKLALALNEQGYKQFLYICPVYDKCFSSPTIPDQLKLATQQRELIVKLKKIKENKRYRIEEATIL